MSSLIKKIRYTKYKNVTKEEAKYFRSIIRECIKENQEITKALGEYYTEVVVYFFKTGREEKQVDMMTEFFERDFKGFDRVSSAAHATSEKNKGLIIVNTDNVKKSSDKRSDFENIRNYHKLIILEELCHLIEHKGSTLNFTDNANELISKYTKYLRTLGKSLDVGYEIIKNLRNNRNHYEVYRMMAKCYPTLFFKRWSVVFWDEDNYSRTFEEWKKNLNQNIALTRLISDYIRRKTLFIIIGDYESYGVKKELIESTLEKCKTSLEELDIILKIESPQLVEQLQKIDESVLSVHENFWDYILYLCEENSLLE